MTFVHALDRILLCCIHFFSLLSRHLSFFLWAASTLAIWLFGLTLMLCFLLCIKVEYIKLLKEDGDGEGIGRSCLSLCFFFGAPLRLAVLFSPTVLGTESAISNDKLEDFLVLCTHCRNFARMLRSSAAARACWHIFGELQ